MNSYCEILGVNANPTMEELKIAYRKKAKLLHPDLNKSENAHQEFLELTTAYEYLRHSITGNFYDSKTNGFYTSAQKTEEWYRTESEKIRARAYKHSHQRYANFKKTAYYKASRTMDNLNDLVGLLVAFVVLLVIPPIAIWNLGNIGLIITGVTIFISAPFWFKELLNIKNILKKNELKSTALLIFHSRLLKYILLSILNVSIFFYAPFNTVINSWYYVLLLCISIAMAYGILFFFIKKLLPKKHLIALELAPLLFNLFFTINYLFASSPTTESYPYVCRYIIHHNYVDYKSSIILENYAYDNESWIRTFFDITTVCQHHRITYHFESGLFGLKVLKGYELEE